MDALADSSPEPVSARRWAQRAIVAAIAIALCVGLVVMVRGFLASPSAPKRQLARIAILPDTPPPPPKEEKKPEPPKDAPRQTMREETVKQDVPKPAEAPIKMEGPAGDGPSAFAAGGVKSDYSGGAPVIGAAGGGTPDRTQERLYASSVRQLLHDEIERHLASDSGELVATFSVWIDPDGTIRRFELVPTGDAGHDAALRAAFEQTSRALHLPGHDNLPQPLRFRLTVRPA
jgi:hypothetical protein